jgi:hypothetical protein
MCNLLLQDPAKAFNQFDKDRQITSWKGLSGCGRNCHGEFDEADQATGQGYCPLDGQNWVPALNGRAGTGRRTPTWLFVAFRPSSSGPSGSCRIWTVGVDLNFVRFLFVGDRKSRRQIPAKLDL